jgi:hypothetical protein
MKIKIPYFLILRFITASTRAVALPYGNSKDSSLEIGCKLDDWGSISIKDS